MNSIDRTSRTVITHAAAPFAARAGTLAPGGVWRTRAVLMFVGAWFCVGPAAAQPTALGDRVRFTATQEVSRLDRATNRVTSSATVTAMNNGDRLIRGPLIIVAELTSPQGVTPVTVTGASGGIGQAPWQWPYFDFTAQIGAGLAPGQSITIPLALVRPNGVTVTYRLVAYGTINHDPLAASSVPAVAVVNQSVVVDGSASTDPDQDPLTYAWDFGDGATGSGAQAQHTFARTGTFTVVLTVTDPAGASDALGIPITVTPEGAFALARTRVLAGDGQPLDGVATQETGPGGERTFADTLADGYLSLGGAPGAYTWRFSKAGHQSVWRQATLVDRRIAFVPGPWLTPFTSETVALTPLFARQLTAAGGALLVQVPAGAATATANAHLTPLGSQALPVPLPLGWSPVAAFVLDLGAATLATPATLTVSPVGNVRADAPCVLARFDAANLRWLADTVTAPGAPLTFDLTAAGVFALVVPDAVPTAPPTATAGAPLAAFAGAAPDLAGLTGQAVVEPNPGFASTNPAETVADVAVLFTSTAAVPSGVFLRTDIDETFTLRNGNTVPGAPYDTSIFAYRSPAGGAATALVAEFPIRPSVALGGDVLAEARVHASVQRADSFAAAIVDATGGSASLDKLRLDAAAGAFARLGVVELREVELTGLTALLGTLSGVRAFDVNLSGLAAGQALAPAFSGLTPNTDFLLARVVRTATRSGLEPVLRLRSGADGSGTSVEPATGARLGGIDGAGRYVLVKLTAPVGLVDGVARNAANTATAGLFARVNGEAWLTLSRASGVFLLVAPPGARTAHIDDSAGEDSGEAAFTLADATSVAAVNLALSGAGLQVTAVTPAASATAVPVITDVRVRFSRKLGAAGFGPTAVELRDAANAAVTASLSLNLAGTEATLLPSSPLGYNTAYRIVVDPALRDLAGGALTGTTEFSFTTAGQPARAGSELVIYEPGAANVPQAILDRLIAYTSGADSRQVIVSAGPGVAEGRAPVTLVNITTGETTAVLAQPDGSFTDWLRASEEDYVQAVIVNSNGTRTTIDATRQLFDDGSVGLFGPGGVLSEDGPGGEYEVEVAPETVKTRTVFKLLPLTLAEVNTALGGVQPAGGAIAGAFRLEVHGQEPKGDVEISFPLDPATLTIPPGETPENGAFALAVVQRIDGEPVFHVVDKLVYENGRLATHSPPYLGMFGFPGFLGPENYADMITAIHVGFGPHTITGRAVLKPFLADYDFEKTEPVVPGASVFAFKAGSSAVARDRFGRIPGWVYTTTGPDGRFSFVVDGDPAAFSVSATHPRFLSAIVGGLTNVAALVSRRVIVFTQESETKLQTSVSAGHNPVFPSPGNSTTLTVTATQDESFPPTLLVSLNSVLPLVPGVTGTIADVTFGQTGFDEGGGGLLRRHYTVSTPKPLRVTFSLTATGSTVARRDYVIDFNGVPPLVGGLTPSDANDHRGPMVAGSFPRPRDWLPAGDPLELWFNEPIDRSVLLSLDQIVLAPGAFTSGATPSVGPGGKPTAELSDDQRRLRLWFPGMLAGQLYTLVFPTAAARDLAGNVLDQIPLTSTDADPFLLTFRSGEQLSKTLPDISSGKGGVLRGNMLFVGDAARISDDGDLQGAVRVFYVGEPQSPVPLRDPDAILAGPPTALTMLPNYSYWAKPVDKERQPVTPEIRRSDLLAVAGGWVGRSAENAAPQKFLRLLEVIETGDSASPIELRPLVTSPVHADDSIITKMVWQPPNIAFLEQWSETTGDLGGPTGSRYAVRSTSRISLLNVQEFIRGNQVWLGDAAHPGGEQAQLPLERDPGFDVNGDGDYTDTGDVQPIPAKLAQGFYGFNGAFFSDEFRSDGSQALFDRSILDFDWRDGLMVGVLTDGFELDANGLPTGSRQPARFQVFAAGDAIEAPDGTLEFGLGVVPARPKRVLALPNVLVDVPQPAAPGFTPLYQREVRSLALVSLSPDEDGEPRLAVIDVTEPTTPVLVHKIAFPADFPDAGGLAQLQSMLRRDDGAVELYTGLHTIVLDPTLLLHPLPTDPDVLHVALQTLFNGAGTGSLSPAATQSGLRPVLELGRNEVVQTAPRMRFVFFPALSAGQSGTDFVGDSTDVLRGLFDKMQPTDDLALARFRAEPTLGISSTLTPASPLVQYHVLIEMPGGGDPDLIVGLRAIDSAGAPLSDPGKNFAPVRYLHPDTLTAIGGQPDCPASPDIVPLVAHRMSDDAASPFATYYLSDPISVVAEHLKLAEVDGLRATGRAVITPGHFIEAFIDPVEENNTVVGSFASAVDTATSSLRVAASVRAKSVPIAYLMGANPPPTGGAVDLPGTAGNVAAHSGEFRHDTEDFSLPSRRMPVIFARTFGGQDNYRGPFGRGWDFNFNQRLVPLEPPVFPANFKYPLVVRATAAASTVATAGDVLMQSGAGRNILFKDAGDTAPAEFTADLLIGDLGWIARAKRFYKPEPGVFDLLVHFRDGKYARLTPNGQQYWYDPDGKLARIVDRFTANWHQLIYTPDGRLRRIVDHAIDADARYLELGYYMPAGGPATGFVAGLDTATSNVKQHGLVARLRDFTNRDVLFEYTSDGRLEFRRGPETTDVWGDGFSGRAVTNYQTDACGDLLAVVAGGTGPEAGGSDFSATMLNAPDGRPIVQGGGGLLGALAIVGMSVSNAAQLDNAVRSVATTDGAKTEFTFDAAGYVKSTTLTGPNATAATTETTYNDQGQLLFIRYPEGNTATFTYDTGNAVLRSRGNVTRIERVGGILGGGTISSEHAFDKRYNLPDGPQTDEGGHTITYTLRGDFREVASIDHGGDGTTTRSHNGFGQLEVETTPDGHTRRTIFNPDTGFAEREENGTVAVLHFYDSSFAGRHGLATRTVLPTGDPITRRYDERLLLVEEARGGATRRMSYDENANPVRIETALSSSVSRIETRKYNRSGFLLESIVANVETDGATAEFKTVHVPDNLNRIATTTRSGGEVETFTYDHQDRITRRTLGDYVETFTYNRNGSLLTFSQGGELIVERQYDGFNRLMLETKHVDSSARTTETYTYFGRGELRSRRLKDSTFDLANGVEVGAVDALGRARSVQRLGTTINPTTTYTYTAGVNGLSMQSVGPRETQTWIYDTGGQLQTETATNETTTYHYDAGNRLERRESTEDGVTHITRTGYNVLDQATSVSDSLGTIANYTPRFDGMVESTTDALGHSTTFTYSLLGEMRSARRQSGVGFGYAYNRNRQPSFVGERVGPPAGDRFTYDTTMRRSKTTKRDGGEWKFENHDVRNKPRHVEFPGGTADLTYDRLGRALTNTVAYSTSPDYRTTFTYDAVGRARVLRFGSGGLGNTLSLEYDAAGPMLSTRLQAAGENLHTRAVLLSDGARASVTYPSNQELVETREGGGRLTKLTTDSQPVYNATAFSGSTSPKTVELGAGAGTGAVKLENIYDARRRLTAIRYTRPLDGALLAELRYAYDAADNRVARQSVHRSGRTDFFSYDVDDRVASAHYGARPEQPGDGGRTLSGVAAPTAGFTTGLYGRTYAYDSGNRDLLETAAVVNPDGVSTIPFVQNRGSFDGFLFAGLIDGVSRPAPDALGNTAGTRLQVRNAGALAPVADDATMKYDGLSRLVRVDRQDGVSIEYEYTPDGLMFHRRVSQAGGTIVVSDRILAWHEGRLVEEYEKTSGSSQLVARYYYAGGDSPIAADLAGSGPGLQRVYYLTDEQESVIGVTDDLGNVLERVRYDAHGQPQIEAADLAAPVVASVVAHADGIVVVFSEAVLPRLLASAPADSLLAGTELPGVAIKVVGQTGQVLVAENFAGQPFGRSYLFKSASPLSGALTVEIAGNMLEDEWGNAVAPTTLAIVAGAAPGTVLFAGAGASTAAAVVARSTVGNPMLFHGQYFEYETGLLYLRARHYDPFTGTFLQRDPQGYDDSVNPYASFRHNPLRYRDPSGELVWIPIAIVAVKILAAGWDVKDAGMAIYEFAKNPSLENAGDAALKTLSAASSVAGFPGTGRAVAKAFVWAARTGKGGKIVASVVGKVDRVVDTSRAAAAANLGGKLTRARMDLGIADAGRKLAFRTGRGVAAAEDEFQWAMKRALEAARKVRKFERSRDAVVANQLRKSFEAGAKRFGDVVTGLKLADEVGGVFQAASSGKPLPGQKEETFSIAETFKAGVSLFGAEKSVGFRYKGSNISIPVGKIGEGIAAGLEAGEKFIRDFINAPGEPDPSAMPASWIGGGN